MNGKLPDLPSKPRRENTSGRAFWIVWCCGWAGVWFILSSLAYTEAAEPNPVWLPWLITAGLSLLAIFIPVGKK